MRKTKEASRENGGGKEKEEFVVGVFLAFNDYVRFEKCLKCWVCCGAFLLSGDVAFYGLHICLCDG